MRSRSRGARAQGQGLALKEPGARWVSTAHPGTASPREMQQLIEQPALSSSSSHVSGSGMAGPEGLPRRQLLVYWPGHCLVTGRPAPSRPNPHGGCRNTLHHAAVQVKNFHAVWEGNGQGITGGYYWLDLECSTKVPHVESWGF